MIKPTSPIYDLENKKSRSGAGHWTEEEHHRFMHAVTLYPCGPWKNIAAIVKTRSIRQIQTQAQKLREKAARHERGLKNRLRVQLAQCRTPLWKISPHCIDQDDLDINQTPVADGLPPLEECLDFFIQLMECN